MVSVRTEFWQRTALRDPVFTRVLCIPFLALLRSGKLIPNPGADFRFESGDRVAVIGHGDAHDAFAGMVRA